MPCISKFFGIMIYMYYREHSPPHFHAIYGDMEAIISIDDSKIIKGKLPPRVLGLVMEWAYIHKDDLLENWNLCQSMDEPKKIKPLE